MWKSQFLLGSVKAKLTVFGLNKRLFVKVSDVKRNGVCMPQPSHLSEGDNLITNWIILSWLDLSVEAVKHPCMQACLVYSGTKSCRDCVSFLDASEAPAGLSCSNWFHYVDVSRWLSCYIMCRQTLRYLSQSTSALLICFSQNDPLHVRLKVLRPTICAPPLSFNFINNLSVFSQTDHRSAKHNDAHLLRVFSRCI